MLEWDEWAVWYHIWPCFQWTWKTDERFLFQHKSTWENLRFYGAARLKASIKAANMYLLFAWIARNTMRVFRDGNVRTRVDAVAERSRCFLRVQVHARLFVFTYSHGAVAISVISSYPLSVISLEIIWTTQDKRRPPNSAAYLHRVSLLIKVN